MKPRRRYRRRRFRQLQPGWAASEQDKRQDRAERLEGALRWFEALDNALDRALSK